MRVRTKALLAFSLSTWPFQALSSVLSEELRTEVERVCGYCHYESYFDEESDSFVEQRFIENRLNIIDRLSRDQSELGYMPPIRSRLSISESVRVELLKALKGVDE